MCSRQRFSRHRPCHIHTLNNKTQGYALFFRGKKPNSGYPFSDYSYNNTVIVCETRVKDWVHAEEFPFNTLFAPGQATQPLRVLCPIQQTASFYLNREPECGLVNQVDVERLTGSFYDPRTTSPLPSYTDVVNLPIRLNGGQRAGDQSPNQPEITFSLYLQVNRANSCPATNPNIVGSVPNTPITTCLNDGHRASYPFWDPKSFGSEVGGAPSQPSPPPPLGHFLPALRLKDVAIPAEVGSRQAGHFCKYCSCRAIWDKNVPVRCGSDMNRFLVANLGARGDSDTESWPALDANNATATTARVTITQKPDGGLQLGCVPQWVTRNGTIGQTYLPQTLNVLLTQSGESLFLFESGEEEEVLLSSIFLSPTTNPPPSNQYYSRPRVPQRSPSRLRQYHRRRRRWTFQYD